MSDVQQTHSVEVEGEEPTETDDSALTFILDELNSPKEGVVEVVGECKSDVTIRDEDVDLAHIEWAMYRCVENGKDVKIYEDRIGIRGERMHINAVVKNEPAGEQTYRFDFSADIHRFD